MNFKKYFFKPITKNNRKLLLVLPILCLPFICLIFWSLRLAPSSKQGVQDESEGLLQLPSTDLNKEREMSKWDLYRNVDKDSADQQNSLESILGKWGERVEEIYPAGDQYAAQTPQFQGYEKQLYDKLAELDRSLNQVYDSDVHAKDLPIKKHIENSQLNEVNYEASLSEPHLSNAPMPLSQHDPEIEQLNTMLDKIIKIQGPTEPQDVTNIQEPQRRQSDNGNMNSTLISQVEQDSLSETAFNSTTFSFSHQSRNAVSAVVHGNQTVGNGSTLKLRLLDDFQVRNLSVPKGSFVYGTVQITGERMRVSVNQINLAGHIISTKLDVHDMDGIPGIYLPEMLERDVIVNSADQSVQSLGLGHNMQSAIVAEAANAGIQVAKSLFSKKAKLIKVELGSDYRILLKDISNFK